MEEYTDRKIFEFNFEFDIKDYIIIHSELKRTTVTIEFDYVKQVNNRTETTCIIPANSILRIDNITMGGRYKRSAVDIVFTFLVKKNKHINLDYKIPNKIIFDVYELNGLKYSILKEDEVDKKMESLIRKNKINNILNEA